MKILDSGHKYEVAVYDGEGSQVITFMKRDGAGYPGNIGSYPGTNCQELLRVLMDRISYLDNQIEHPNNTLAIQHLREVLWLFEARAAERHGINKFAFTPENIYPAPACDVCGHVVCHGHTAKFV